MILNNGQGGSEWTRWLSERMSDVHLWTSAGAVLAYVIATPTHVGIEIGVQPFFLLLIMLGTLGMRSAASTMDTATNYLAQHILVSMRCS